jgi:hypothetical protein
MQELPARLLLACSAAVIVMALLLGILRLTHVI